MADSEQVTSTTPFEEELRDNKMGDLNEFGSEAIAKDVVKEDEILDLAGGAHDAIERHKATLSEDMPKEFTEPMLLSEAEVTKEVIPDSTHSEEEVVSTIPEPVHTEIVEPIPKPVREPTPEPPREPTPEPPREPTPEPPREPTPEPPREPTPEPPREPTPEPTFIAPVEPPKAAPVAVEEVLLKAATDKEPTAAPAPASYEPFLLPAPSQLLMQFPTELGQKGDCPAPLSPLSPLHSPDSLEELSLSESPNQPPYSASAGAASFWPPTEPPKTLSKDSPWGEEGNNSRSGLSKHDEDIVSGLEAATRSQLKNDPLLSLEKDLGSKSLCEDSGVSVSPEDNLFSLDRSTTTPSQLPSNPQMVPESHTAPASSNPTEHWDSPFLASQDNSRVSMDTFSKDTAPPSGSPGYEPDMLGQSDDDLMFEVKKNPFDGFSPMADTGFSHFGDVNSDSRAAKMSESPTPDLVQYGQAGDSQDSPPSYYDETKTYESCKMAANSLMGQFPTTPKEGEDSAFPPSLPDIIKSFPLNPEKVDSGSSEGSTEQSPEPIRKIIESPKVPVNWSATNPIAFDSKMLLLKEMAEMTEAKAAEKKTPEPDKSVGAFDLVKEAETTPQSKGPIQIEQKDWFTSQDSPKMTDRFEPLNFQSGKANEDSDSESPSADSLSPVLEAMAKNPSIFQVETEEKDMKMEEPEAGEEISEPEVSSEEFEFIERPPRGVIDEFLEALDNSKFAKAPELDMDDDMSFGQKEMASTNVTSEVQEETPSQSSASYLLLTQPSDKTSPQKANLEKADLQQPPSQAPLIHSPVRKPETLAKDMEGAKTAQMPTMSAVSVVELLYWRDVKTTGVVFGASLFLLLSLTVCSIVSVCSYVGLALLSVTICFRIYKGILQAIQKSDEGHPFKLYLDQDVALSEDAVHKYSDAALARLNKTIASLRCVFLVEDLVDSLKFAVLMWILTYVGALFNGLTLLIMGLVGVFSCPIIYEKYQVQIDHYIGLVNNQIKDVVAKIQAKVPGLKRKAE